MPHELHTWLPPIVMWHALKPAAEFGLHPSYVLGSAYREELKAWRPMPQVVAPEDAAAAALEVRELTEDTRTVLLAAAAELAPPAREIKPEAADVTAPEAEDVAAPVELAPTAVEGVVAVVARPALDALDEASALETEELRAADAADTRELTLAIRAELVMVLTGTNDEPTSDTLERTVAETELVTAADDDADVLMLDTKLKVGEEETGAEDGVLPAAAGFVEVTVAAFTVVVTTAVAFAMATVTVVVPEAVIVAVGAGLLEI